MKKLLLIPLLVLVISGLMLSGCPAPAEEPTVEEPEAFKWPDSISIGVPPIENSRYIQAAAVAPVMERMTGSKIRLLPEATDPTRARWVKDGKVQLCNDGLGAVAQCTEGASGYATREGGPYLVRVVWQTQAAPLGFAVRADSDIKTIYDIKPGMKCPVVKGLPASEVTYNAFFAWIQVDRDSLVGVPFSDWSSSVRALAEGKVDVTYASLGAPYVVEVAAGPHGIRWLDMDPNKDPEGAKRFLAVKGTLGFAPAEVGHPSGRGVNMLSVPTAFTTRAETGTELIYNIAKWLGENYDAYKDTHELNALMSIDAFRKLLDSVYHPVHEGTIRYLKEKGVWTAKDDARQKKNIDLQSRYIEAYQAAIADADKKGIKVDPTNEEWMDLWASHKKDIPRLKVEY